MLLQNFSRVLNVLCASFLLLTSSLSLAELVININQTCPAAPACVRVGDTVTYAITVTNCGPGAVRCITLNDVLTSSTTGEAGVSLVSVSTCSAPCEQFVITPNANGFNLSATEKLGVNQSFVITATFRVCTTLSDGVATLTNTVTATGVDCLGNVISTAQTQTTCVEGCALAVTVSPLPGNFTTQVCNDGSITFTANVTGSCENPSLLNYVWSTNPIIPIVQPNSNTLTIPGNEIPACDFGTLTASVVVTDNSTGCTATGTSGEVCSIACADLSINKTVTSCHDQITYTITVTNNSTTTQSVGVVVNDCIPSCLTILSITPDNQAWNNFTVNNNCITGSLSGALSPLSFASFVVVTKITGCCGKSICNTATVSSGTFDPNLSNNSATVKVNRKKH